MSSGLQLNGMYVMATGVDCYAVQFDRSMWQIDKLAMPLPAKALSEHRPSETYVEKLTVAADSK